MRNVFVSIHIYWFVLPLVASISLVYAASRRESWPRIWSHALRISSYILGLLVVLTVVLLVINTRV